MSSKMRAILLAVVLATAGLAGCADTDDGPDVGDDRDNDTGDRDTGDRDTGDRDTGDRDTDEDDRFETFNKTFEDEINDTDYERNWTFPVNATGANITAELNLEGAGTDDVEAEIFDINDTLVCSMSDEGGDLSPSIDDDKECEEESENEGTYTIAVEGSSTAGSANYTINVTVEYEQQQGTGTNDTNESPQDSYPRLLRG